MAPLTAIVTAMLDRAAVHVTLDSLHDSEDDADTDEALDASEQDELLTNEIDDKLRELDEHDSLHDSEQERELDDSDDNDELLDELELDDSDDEELLELQEQEHDSEQEQELDNELLDWLDGDEHEQEQLLLDSPHRLADTETVPP